MTDLVLDLWHARGASGSDVVLDIGASIDDLLISGQINGALMLSASFGSEVIVSSNLVSVISCSMNTVAELAMASSMDAVAGFSVDSDVRYIDDGAIDAAFSAFVPLMPGAYDINVYRGPSQSQSASWTHSSGVTTAQDVTTTPTRRVWPDKSVICQDGRPVSRSGAIASAIASSVDVAMAPSWTVGAKTDLSSALPFFAVLPRIDEATRCGFDAALKSDRTSSSLFVHIIPRCQATISSHFYDAQVLSFDLLSQQIERGAILRKELVLGYDEALWPAPGRHDLPIIPVPDKNHHASLRLQRLRLSTALALEFVFDGEKTVYIPDRRVYFVINSIEFYRTSGGQAIPISSASVTLDTDSMAWQLTASIPRISDARALNGDQVTLVINGHSWQFVIDSWSESRSYSQRGATVTGRSLSAKLSASLSLKRSHTEQAARTMIQLAEAELPDGWTIDWQAADWLVDAGAWSYASQSPIEAIQTLSTAAGSFIYPALNTQLLTVKPLFNALPWALSNIAPDIYVPDSIITTLGSQYQRKQQADGVWVSGGSAGVSVFVKRTGTSGSNQLSDVTNSLITTTAAARALGGTLLAQSLPYNTDTLQMPISSDTGLVTPGLVVETDSGIGYARGIKVSASVNNNRAVSVNQQVEVDRYEVA